MAKILLVEDELQMQRGVKDNLEFEGHEVDIAPDGTNGLLKLLDNSYDLVLLDVMLPQMSGFDVCKKAREKGITTPIIMLTALSNELARITGLASGANDYVSKPFSPRQLVARVKDLLDRTPASPSSSSS